jgi:hypothetical protein
MSMRTIAAAAVLALTAPAAAQSPPRPDDPAVKTAPAAPAPASAYAGYRRYEDEAPLPWREANDEVGRLQGHLGHMKPAPQSAPPQQPGATAPPATPRGHGHAH